MLWVQSKQNSRIPQIYKSAKKIVLTSKDDSELSTKVIFPDNANMLKRTALEVNFSIVTMGCD